MKEERLLFLVKTRLDQSLETLEDARALLSAGRSPPSILNRSYYGVFYAALALLQTIGETPSKHSGVLSLFDIEFYKRGVVHERNVKSASRALRVASGFGLQVNRTYFTRASTRRPGEGGVFCIRCADSFAAPLLCGLVSGMNGSMSAPAEM